MALTAVSAHTTDHQGFGGISLSIHRAESVAILGLDAAGKSLFCRILSGDEPLSSGSLRVGGCEVPAPPESRDHPCRDVGLVESSGDLPARLSVIDNVTRAQVRTRGMSPILATERARALLARVEMLAEARTVAGKLSNDQRRLVQIARALALTPRLLVMDDPTGELGPSTGRLIADVVREATREGTAVVLATDDLTLVREAASRVIVVGAGRIVEDQPAADFFLRPGTPQARDILARLARADVEPEAEPEAEPDAVPDAVSGVAEG
ncbi:ATP-binding cassette domain-containing protein [Mycetocola lacteus]|uniref:ATP-binding cassette domain-containing protein n=1 Tax=Mycetocola lacteus TaxID=76637 RepID=UPI001602218F|nr:ATP-binding cassette domain-containing protein [Mycetocola lacteus]